MGGDSPMTIESACKILQINSSCSLELLKKTFKDLALKFHPDKQRNGKLSSEEDNLQMIQVTKAYKYMFKSKLIQIESYGIIRDLNLTEEQKKALMQQLSPNEFPLTLTFEEIFTGCEKFPRITRRVVLQGGGENTENPLVYIQVKPGSIENTRITVPGEGDREYGKLPADVIFIVRESPHSIFRRNRFDLEYTATITMEEACSGKVTLLTLANEGKFIHPVNEVLTKNTVLRIANRGFPILNSNGMFGALVVRFEIIASCQQQDPPVISDLFCSISQVKNGCTKKVEIERSITNAEEFEIMEKIILLIEVPPETKWNHKFTFERMGDQRPGVVPADLIFIVRQKPIKNDENRQQIIDKNRFSNLFLKQKQALSPIERSRIGLRQINRTINQNLRRPSLRNVKKSPNK